MQLLRASAYAEDPAVTPYRPSTSSSAAFVGLAHGLNGASNGLSLFTGVVLPLARMR